ncbi:hypothetical protein [Acidovorax sp. BLS4]|uniref:hypothetical protein n=1 Tax=Acidovorax sp. BLS4 TaxID=3273430 RepID=UPI002943AABA|nr:hypothetical protein [Paracidovorax avenae]WOI45886.1 hypothetical protein R1Z03_01325 [Paracidovorax avenae]
MKSIVQAVGSIALILWLLGCAKLIDVHVCIGPVGSCKVRSLPAARTVNAATTPILNEAV